MNLEEIIKEHTPEYKYRVSESSYKKGTTFPGTQRAGKIYILKGSCKHTFGEQNMCELPEGPYHFEALENVTIVNVWELPKEFWNIKKKKA